MPSIRDELRQQVFSEAGHRCEYCRTSRRLVGMPLVVDHVIPRSLSGSDERSNLAAACYRCNEFKAAKTHVQDHVTGAWVPLFHPRAQVWSQHFAWADGGVIIIGLTPTGRATVAALRLNNEYVMEARALWVSRGWHPPID